jgi:hypothetical protein
VDVAEVLGHKDVTTTLTFYAHKIPGDMGYIDRLTAARQVKGDLNGDFVKAAQTRKPGNTKQKVVSREGLEPSTP